MERASPVVALHGLAVGPRPQVVLIEAIDWEVRPGTVVGLVGAIGSGKSSLLRTLGLLQPPLGGTLKFLGRTTDAASPVVLADLRRRLGLALADQPWLRLASVRENLALPLRVHDTASPEIDRVVGEFLDWLGLGTRASLPVGDLSDGERRLLRVARAAITRPDLLLADEPFAGLDAAATRRLQRLFQELARLGTAVVVTAAEAAVVNGLVAETWKLDDGRLWPADAAALRLVG
ncbi:MAG: ATP-binding cassette domain-containing protein [Pseudomonadota bacterium]